jgi:hypothetical protein
MTACMHASWRDWLVLTWHIHLHISSLRPVPARSSILGLGADGVGGCCQLACEVICHSCAPHLAAEVGVGKPCHISRQLQPGQGTTAARMQHQTLQPGVEGGHGGVHLLIGKHMAGDVQAAAYTPMTAVEGVTFQAYPGMCTTLL